MWRFVKKFSKKSTHDALEKYLKKLPRDTRDAYLTAFSRHPEIAKSIVQKHKKRIEDRELSNKEKDTIMMEILADEEEKIFDIAAGE
jgi:thioester reductase-like protein